MTGSKYYGNAIWTNHALERLGHRGLSQGLAWKAFQYPEKTLSGKNGSSEYQKWFGKSKVTVIAKQNEKYQWVIISCWIDPPLEGTQDYYKKRRYIKYQKSGFWGKLWMDFLSALGL